MRDDDVLAVNAAFYRAFAERDAPAMDRIWARRATVTCIHPGWSRLVGREAVMRSWRGILSNPGSPVVECSGAAAYHAGDAAYVLCLETVTGGAPSLIATNLFVLEDDEWRLVHHQAGPVSASVGDEIEEEDESPAGGGGLLN